MSRNEIKNSELPIFMTVDKILVGYLASITNTTINEVVSTIRDLADKPLQRLRGRDQGKHTYCFAEYPGVGVCFKIKCERSWNYNQRRLDEEEYENRFRHENNCPPDQRVWNHPNWQQWKTSNPQPRVDYTCILITLEVRNSNNMMHLSDDEVSLLAIESIFLGAAIQDEELESSKH